MMRSPKDFWSGVLYMLFGSVALYIGRDYSMGTALRMGPAYFPSLLGGALLFMGAIAVIRSFLVQGAPIGALAWHKVVFIVGSVVLFGLTVRGLGLLISLPLLVICSAFASSRFGWRSSITLAAGLTAFCVFVFLKGLGVPLPMLGTWIGG
jgi:putative tricarboxylic transport membrane protein